MLEMGLGVFNRWALKLLTWLAIGLLALMTVIVLTAVFYRYVLSDAVAWSEEIAKFLMVWMTFMAAPIAYRQGALVAVEALPHFLKGRLHWLLVLMVQVVVIAIMVIFVKEGSFLTWNARIQTASTIEVSISAVYVSMPIGGLVLLTVSLQMALESIGKIIRPPPPGEDPVSPAEMPGAM
jgi:TRAP-type C4-dicarboxylate transport system permease small subunit